MKAGITVKQDNLKSALARIKTLTANEVLVGVPSDHSYRDPEPGDPEDAGRPLNNAEIGYLMENGAPEANIPERPHLVPGVRSVDREVAARYKAGSKAVLDGRAPNLDSTHTAVGLIAENAVKAKITDGPFTPLAESTLAERRRRGRTGDRPLIDTGQYRRAQTHVVRKRGK